MADLIDNAQEQEAVFLKAALSNRPASLPYRQKCHWCDAPVSPNAHFCDADCRQDFEQHRRLNGGFSVSDSFGDTDLISRFAV